MIDTTTTNRRNLMLGAAALPLAGAAASAAGAAGAAVPAQQGVLRPGIYRFKLGAFEVTSILDGAVQLDGPHPIFGQNVTQEDVANLAAENFLPPTRMEIPFTNTLVNTGSELILFDTGNGDNGRRPAAGNLVASLKSLGIEPG
ncbi:MAG: MBL fold metallo-hydrolase, partial [Pseudomonadota bacterium]